MTKSKRPITNPQAEARAAAVAAANVETELQALERQPCICQICGAEFDPAKCLGALYPPPLCPNCEAEIAENVI